MIQEIDIHQRIQNYHNIKNKKELLVIEVANNSPAAKAGIRIRDIIVAFNNQVVGSSSDLFKQLGHDQIFDPSEIKLIRKSELKTVRILPGTKSAA
jgi:serine protease Do